MGAWEIVTEAIPDSPKPAFSQPPVTLKLRDDFPDNYQHRMGGLMAHYPQRARSSKRCRKSNHGYPQPHLTYLRNIHLLLP